MLNAMREGAKSGIVKFILFGFMVMAVFGLVLMDVGGFFRGGVRSNTVAEIAGSELPITSFDQIVRRTLARQGMDPQTAYQFGFIHQILFNEINNNLIRGAARDIGINVSDNLVIDHINVLLAPYVMDKEITARRALRQVLRAQNMTENQFVEAVRNEMTNNILRNAFYAAGGVPSETEARDLYIFQNETRFAEAVILPHDRVIEYEEPTDELLKPLYEAGKEKYRIPETRSFTLAILNQDSLEGTYEISKEELQAYYEENPSTFTLPQRRVVKQAVLENRGDAQAIVETVLQNKSLEDAVKEVTGSKDAYLGEEEFEKRGLPRQLRQPVFSAEKETVVGPVETELGWHVIYVQDVLPWKKQPFKDVREDIRKVLLQDHMADQLFALANTVDDRLAAGTELEEVAEDLGLELSAYGPVREDGSTPDDKEGMEGFSQEDRGYILETAFALNEGEVSPVMELSDGRFAAIRVDSITPLSYRPYEDVQPELKASWINIQKEVENKIKSQEFYQALQIGKTTLQAIAKENDAKVRTLELERQGALPEGVSTEAAAAFFNVDENGYVITSTENAYILGQVKRIEIPESANQDDLKQLQDGLTRQIPDELLQLYLGYLHEKFDVEVNTRLLETTYGPGSEQF